MEQQQQQQQQKHKERVSSADAQPLLPSHHVQRQRSETLQQRLQADNHQQQAPTHEATIPSQQTSSSKSTILLLYAALLLGLIYRLASHDVSSESSSLSSQTLASSYHLLRLHSDSTAGSSTAFGYLPSRDSSKIDSYESINDMYSSSTSSQGTLNVPCAYGSLAGTWVSTAALGERWQVLDPHCQLTNWLEVYRVAGQNSSSSSRTNRSISSSDSSGVEVAVGVDDSQTGSDADATVAHDECLKLKQQQEGQACQPPMVRILLLSDSVDRFIVEHVCGFFGGTKGTHMMRATPDAEEAERAAQEALSNFEASQQQPAAAAAPAAAAPAAAPTGPTLLNKTAYAFHTCETAAPIKLASSYFPGVHPTGPYHRFSAQNYKKRIDTAREMWTEYAGQGHEPDMISVASLLWDVARMFMHERSNVEGRQELERALLDVWVKNYTAVVQYAQTVFPETKLWVTHTTMPPHHDERTGLMGKPYLGRLYFIHQLNAAAVTAAHMLGLQLVDYEAMSERFIVGQEHLVDMIHPNAIVGVEVFNVMLNLVMQQQRLQQSHQQVDSGGL